MAHDRIRILIADDHEVVREGLAQILGRQGDFEVVGEASNGEECLALHDALQPDVLLLDLRMPVLDGFGVVAALALRRRAAKVVVLTTYEGDNDVRRVLTSGARGYLLKDAPRELIWSTIRRVHAGVSALAPGLAEKVAASLCTEALTPRELDVLRLMAAGRTNKQIGASLQITEGTAKSHVNGILGKLHAKARTEAVVIAVQRGLVHLH